MRFTKRQGSEKTLADMYRAMDRQHPVTITALKEEKDERGKKTGRLVPTVRTIELYAIETTAAGNLILIAMDRESGQRRSFRLDRVLSYTTHRTGYLVPRETPATSKPARPAAPTSVAALIAYEVARDERGARHFTPAA